MRYIERLRPKLALALVGLLLLAIVRDSVTQLGGLGLSANQLKTHAEERALLERFTRLRELPAQGGAALPTEIGFHMLAPNTEDVEDAKRDSALLRSMVQYGFAPLRVVADDQATIVLAVARDATTPLSVPAGYALIAEAGGGCWWLERVAP
ncbi:MAG: hypothetical protein ACKVX7_03550 [Planctomycetota bacterium]